MSMAGIDPGSFKTGKRSSVFRKGRRVMMSGYQPDRGWCSPSASIAANSTPAKPNQLINAWATVDLPIRPVDCNEQMILLGPGLPSSCGSPGPSSRICCEVLEGVLIIVPLPLADKP